MYGEIKLTCHEQNLLCIATVFNPLTALPFSSRKTINTEVKRALFNTLFLSEMRKLDYVGVCGGKISKIAQMAEWLKVYTCLKPCRYGYYAGKRLRGKI